ncbi:MAG: exodeoxyribonuclease V subunit alpha [Propionibacteriaceae bacterium]|jgi:exodeoxyribonuclease V alpha subunit|nr:exodeoxyribonuclease V subunit alpha [Propionibacteriaceae bacterium]
MTAPKGATGLLARWCELGALDWGDYHAATKIAHLYDEPTQEVQLALALTVRALQAGSTCLALEDASSVASGRGEDAVEVPRELWPALGDWLAMLQASPLVAARADGPGDRPLRLVGGRLYLERYWQDESRVAAELLRRRGQVVSTAPFDGPPCEEGQSAPVATGGDHAGGRPGGPSEVRGASGQLAQATTPSPSDRDPNGFEAIMAGADPCQRLAAAVAARAGVCVIAGGPGTGKTATIARLVALLRHEDPGVRLALAAPTGKAAARLDESLAASSAGLPDAIAQSLAGLRATTIHRLLGWTPESRTRFRHRADNPLVHDVVVVDEASMLSLVMMERLLEALRPDARLVLVGDPDQLAPVEAGAVLADIVSSPGPALTALDAALADIGLPPSAGTVRLTVNHRFDSGIAAVAQAVLGGDVDEVLAAIAACDNVTFLPEPTGLQQRVLSWGAELARACDDGDAGAALEALERQRLLCARRTGEHGIGRWNRQVDGWLRAAGLRPPGRHYPGLPLLVNANAPELGLFNGDTGVVMAAGGGAMEAWFSRGGEPVAVAPSLLPDATPAYAMTVHKAQGSQFDSVTVLLPEGSSPLLTRQLLYTAVTRARREVHIVGPPSALASAVANSAQRATGLAARL